MGIFYLGWITVEDSALDLLRTFGLLPWKDTLDAVEMLPKIEPGKCGSQSGVSNRKA